MDWAKHFPTLSLLRPLVMFMLDMISCGWSLRKGKFMTAIGVVCIMVRTLAVSKSMLKFKLEMTTPRQIVDRTFSL